MAWLCKHMYVGNGVNFHQGATVRECPPKLLVQLLKDEVLVPIGKPATLMPDFMEEVDKDVLDALNRDQLVQVIRLNKLAKLIQPMSDWTDEELRSGIRQVTEDPSKLTLSAVKVSEVGDPPSTPSLVPSALIGEADDVIGTGS